MIAADQLIPAHALRPGVHEIRRPGEDEWLPVARNVVRTDRRGRRGQVFLIAGDREFVTTGDTLWPAREAALVELETGAVS